MISFPDNFSSFSLGPNKLASAYSSPSYGFSLHGDSKAIRRLIREQFPPTPGVYGMIGVDQEIIYVGESKNLRSRLLSYFTGMPASTKVRRMIEETKSIVWEKTGHEFTALLRELELIRCWQPRFNARGKPGRRRRATAVARDRPTAPP